MSTIYTPSSIPLRIPFAPNRGFNFTKPIRVTNQTTKLTDYQIEVNLNTSNFAFEKARSDGADIRFQDANGKALTYWIESWSAASATVWVKLDELEAYEDRIIWMIYGNSDTINESDGNNTFEFFDSEWRTIPKEQNATSTYDAFGILIKTDADTILHFYREGTSHALDKGKIVKRTYTISTMSWSGTSDIFVDGTYDCRDACGGIIDNKIFLFFTRYNHNTDTYIDLGYIKSTDLTGSSWGSRVTLPTTANYRFNGHGGLIHITGTTYLQSWYEHNGIGTWNVNLYKTINSGDDWTTVSIYSGATQLCEPSIAYIGDSKLIAMMGINDGGYVQQATSSDSGDSWSAVANTNLGASTGKKIPFIIYDAVTGNAITVYHCRTDDETKITETDADTVYASASTWNVPTLVDWGFDKNGYVSIVKVSSSRYFFVYSKEISSSDADIWGCEHPLKWSRTNSPTVSDSVVHLNDDDAILGETAFGYNYAIVARAKADEQDIRFVMFGDTLGLNCQNRLGITNSDGVPNDFDRMDYFATKSGSSLGEHTTASDFRNTYYKYQIKRISGQVDYYQGSTHLGTITASANLPIISLYPKAIVWDSSQESTLDIDWVFVRKYISNEPSVEIL